MRAVYLFVLLSSAMVQAIEIDHVISSVGFDSGENEDGNPAFFDPRFHLVAGEKYYVYFNKRTADVFCKMNGFGDGSIGEKRDFEKFAKPYTLLEMNRDLLVIEVSEVSKQNKTTDRKSWYDLSFTPTKDQIFGTFGLDKYDAFGKLKFYDWSQKNKYVAAKKIVCLAPGGRNLGSSYEKMARGSN